MVSSLLRWVVSLSSLESLVRFSKRVCAVETGFLHLFWTNELNGPNGIVGKPNFVAGNGGLEWVLVCNIISI